MLFDERPDDRIVLQRQRAAPVPRLVLDDERVLVEHEAFRLGQQRVLFQVSRRGVDERARRLERRVQDAQVLALDERCLARFSPAPRRCMSCREAEGGCGRRDRAAKRRGQAPPQRATTQASYF